MPVDVQRTRRRDVAVPPWRMFRRRWRNVGDEIRLAEKLAKVEFLRLKRTSHGIRDAANAFDRQRREIDWTASCRLAHPLRRRTRFEKGEGIQRQCAAQGPRAGEEPEEQSGVVVPPNPPGVGRT